MRRYSPFVMATLVVLVSTTSASADETEAYWSDVLVRVDRSLEEGDFPKSLRALESGVASDMRCDDHARAAIILRFARLCDWSPERLQGASESTYMTSLRTLAGQAVTAGRSPAMVTAMRWQYRQAAFAPCCRALVSNPKRWSLDPAEYTETATTYVDDVDIERLLVQFHIVQPDQDVLRTVLVDLLYAGFVQPQTWLLRSVPIGEMDGGTGVENAAFIARLEERRRMHLAPWYLANKTMLTRVMGHLREQLQDEDFRTAFVAHWAANLVRHDGEEGLLVTVPELGSVGAWRKLYGLLAEDGSLAGDTQKAVADALNKVDAAARGYRDWLVHKGMARAEKALEDLEDGVAKKFALERLRATNREMLGDEDGYKAVEHWLDYAYWAHDTCGVNVPLGILSLLWFAPQDHH